MKSYTIQITEKLQKNFTVEADNKNEAKALVEKLYKDADIMLDDTDFIGYEMECITQ